MRKFRSLSWLLLAAVAMVALALPMASQAQIAVGVSVHIGPPALPVYAQPPCPEPGFIWTPGYWAYGDAGYFWVPDTWVRAPAVGLLWTPGYWGWGGGGYLWHAGYWGPHVGFYGGINYGFGYGGIGYLGGRWNGGVFAYNRAVNNVNVTVIHNTYNETVVNNQVNRVSFNGGNGGINARPTPAEETAGREQHVPVTSEQTQHEQASGRNRTQFASVNHGQPGVAATGRPGAFTGSDVVAARGAGGNAGRPNNSGGANNAAPRQNSFAARSGESGGQPRANSTSNNSRPANTQHANGGNKPAKPAKEPKGGGERGDEHEKR